MCRHRQQQQQSDKHTKYIIDWFTLCVCVCVWGTVAVAGQAVAVPVLQLQLQLLRLATFVNEFVCLLHISSCCRFSSHCSLYCFVWHCCKWRGHSRSRCRRRRRRWRWFDTQATPLPVNGAAGGGRGMGGLWSAFGYVPRWQCDAFKKQSILISI